MTSVLDQMIAGTTQRKADKAATLTPVGTEKGGPLATPGRVPLDTPHVLFAREGLLETAADLEKQAEFLLNVARDLRAMAGEPGEVAAATDEALDRERKLQEREADRRAADREKAEGGDKRAAARVEAAPSDQQFEEDFEARMKRLQDEAQAATFTANDAPVPEPEPVVAASGSTAEGWVCPEHGDANLKELTSRKGRKYRACQTCTQFEK